MCLIIFDWQPDAERILTFASNRDEFYQRPTLAAQYWDEHPTIYGGRDLQMGGTWLAVSSRMRLAAVTNYRAPEPTDDKLSRGEIPFSFLKDDMPATDYAKALASKHSDYAGFNALLFDGHDLVYTSNRSEYDYQVLAPGCYGLSNHLLNSPWPKVERAKQALQTAITSTTELNQSLLNALQDQEVPADHLLPDTGFDLHFERMLSPIFITSPDYGTRSSSVVIIQNSGTIHFTERNYRSPDDYVDSHKVLNQK